MLGKYQNKRGMQEERKAETGLRYRQVFLFGSFPSTINGMIQRDRATGKALPELVWQ